MATIVEEPRKNASQQLAVPPPGQDLAEAAHTGSVAVARFRTANRTSNLAGQGQTIHVAAPSLAPLADQFLPTRMAALEIRRIIIEQSYRAHVGHIGSALSIADIIAALYGVVLRIDSCEDPNRDRFILSKGHAALALYAALHLRGWISWDELNCFCGDGSLLGVHPEFEQRGIDFTTGSLGQGLSMAVGAALAARWQLSSRRVFVLLSDAECNEGSVWEAVMLAKQQRLGNLIAVIDVNGQQALDYTNRVLDLDPLEDRWRAFGWDTHVVDGHNPDELASVMLELDTRPGPPHVVLAKTVSGKGVSFMQNQIQWHYLPLSREQRAQALWELEAIT
jgi:transketolase